MNTLRNCECGNCDWTGDEAELGRPLDRCKDLNQRLDAGATVPAGECPVCYAFAYFLPTRWTVLLQRPDYIAANYGEDDFMWQGAAADSIDALEFARAAAIVADGGEEICDEPTDYRCLVLLAGIHDDQNPELGQ